MHSIVESDGWVISYTMVELQMGTAILGKHDNVCQNLLSECHLTPKLNFCEIIVMEFQLSYFKSYKMML